MFKIAIALFGDVALACGCGGGHGHQPVQEQKPEVQGHHHAYHGVDHDHHDHHAPAAAAASAGDVAPELAAQLDEAFAKLNALMPATPGTDEEEIVWQKMMEEEGVTGEELLRHVQEFLANPGALDGEPHADDVEIPVDNRPLDEQLDEMDEEDDMDAKSDITESDDDLDAMDDDF